MNRLVIHILEELGSQIFYPVAVEVHDPELPERLNIDDSSNHGIMTGSGIGYDVSVVVYDMGVASGDVNRMFHSWMQINRANIGANHVEAVELRMSPVLDHPAASARVGVPCHWHGFARAITDFSPIQRQCTNRLRILAVAATDRADIADVIRFEDGIESFDTLPKQLHPSIVDVVRRA